MQIQESEPDSKDSENSPSKTTTKPLLDEVFNDLDLPIVLRKGVRSYTKHPICNFVFYNELSPSYRAFFHEDN